jgi:hypothetical protein
VDDSGSISRVLNIFSLMVGFDLESKTDAEALSAFLALLRKEDPFILVTRDGPMFLALARRLGFVPPGNRERLYAEELPPDQVLEVLTRWERFRANVHELDGGCDFIATYGRGPHLESPPSTACEKEPPAPAASPTSPEVMP